MKPTLNSLLVLVALAIGGVLGASALSALAQSGSSWAPPTLPPPDGNVAAPINTGDSDQRKLGSLMVGLDSAGSVIDGLATGNAAIFGNFTFNPGGTITAGQVLTAINEFGDVQWRDAGAGSASEPFAFTNDMFAFKRGASANGDKILWCPNSHRYLVSCSVVDDQAPAATSLSDLPDACSSDGLCDRSSDRTTLGGDYIYLETVRRASYPNAMGCISYDRNHSHTSYKLEIMCMGTPPPVYPSLSASAMSCTYSRASSGSDDYTFNVRGSATGGDGQYGYFINYRQRGGGSGFGSCTSSSRSVTPGQTISITTGCSQDPEYYGTFLIRSGPTYRVTSGDSQTRSVDCFLQ